MEQCRARVRDMFTKHPVVGFESAPEDVQGMGKFAKALVAMKDEMDARLNTLQVCILVSLVLVRCAFTWSLQFLVSRA